MKGKILHAIQRVDDWRSSELHCIKLYQNILFYQGAWPRENDRGGFLAYRFWLGKCLFCVVVYNTFFGIPMKAYTSAGKDLPLTVESLAAFFISMLFLSYYICLLFLKQRMEGMFCSLDETREAGKSLPLQPEAILQQTRRWSEWTLAFLLGSFVAVICFSSMVPALTARREFIYFAWYPFDELASPYYEIVSLVTFIVFMYGAVITACVYVMLEALLVEAIGQLRLLSYNLSHISPANSVMASYTHSTQNVKVNLGKEKDVTINALLSVQRKSLIGASRIQMVKNEAMGFRIFVDHHCLIHRFVGDIELTFNFILANLLLCVLAPTSLGLVLILYSEEINKRLVFTLILVITNTCGTGILCWLADRLTVESEEVRNAVFGSNWFGAPSSFKQCMGIILSRCNRPIVVRVAGFVPLSAETFYKVTKLTYSYCMTTITYFQRNS